MASKNAILNPPTNDDLFLICEHGRRGVTEISIAGLFNISIGCWKSRKKEYSEIQTALDIGRAKGEDRLVGRLWDVIENPGHKQHLTAVIFLLKARYDYRDRDAAVLIDGNYPSRGKVKKIDSKGE